MLFFSFKRKKTNKKFLIGICIGFTIWFIFYNIEDMFKNRIYFSIYWNILCPSVEFYCLGPAHVLFNFIPRNEIFFWLPLLKGSPCSYNCLDCSNAVGESTYCGPYPSVSAGIGSTTPMDTKILGCSNP